MAKPINEFGGWLRVFQEILWFETLMLAIKVPFLCIHIFKEPYGLLTVLNIIVTVWIFFILRFSFKILARMKNRSKGMPSFIVKYYTLILELFLGASVFDFVFTLTTVGVESISREDRFFLILSIMISLVLFLIWVSYFKKSKRVRSYYGCNAL